MPRARAAKVFLQSLPETGHPHPVGNRAEGPFDQVTECTAWHNATHPAQYSTVQHNTAQYSTERNPVSKQASKGSACTDS
mmetsp:Transcript_7001/g.20310  ORF Transcript_7001/g.20310 Transcript_7001/m.20310 type:complete len:80 (+) Transcript_7001:3938-4177(+)